MSHGMELEFLLPGLLTTTSLYLGQSSIDTDFKSLIFGMSIFSGLISSPSASKPFVNNFFSNIIYKIERYFTREQFCSKVSNAINMNDMLLELENNPQLIGKDFSNFFSQEIFFYLS